MRTVRIIHVGDPLRAAVELFVRSVYKLKYDASLGLMAWPLIAMIDDENEILCAAGLRSKQYGFFSESYFEVPIESVLHRISGQPVSRDKILEVVTLTSRAPSATGELVRGIQDFGERTGFAWSFFTLTGRLSTMLERLGHQLIFLAAADHRRLADAEVWGNYYDTRPKVFALAGARVQFVNIQGTDVPAHA
jgi:hypothetical protein